MFHAVMEIPCYYQLFMLLDFKITYSICVSLMNTVSRYFLSRETSQYSTMKEDCGQKFQKYKVDFKLKTIEECFVDGDKF